MRDRNLKLSGKQGTAGNILTEIKLREFGQPSIAMFASSREERFQEVLSTIMLMLLVSQMKKMFRRLAGGNRRKKLRK